MEWFLPIETVSEFNCFQNRWVKSKRHSKQKEKVKKWWILEKKEIKLPCTITLTRISPRTLDDDNLLGALKWIRDAVADQIFPGKAPGRADNDSRLSWKYKQEKGKQKGIKIEISFLL